MAQITRTTTDLVDASLREFVAQRPDWTVRSLVAAVAKAGNWSTALVSACLWKYGTDGYQDTEMAVHLTRMIDGPAR